MKKEVNEDGEGVMATPDSVNGMGQPQYASRGADGSGDVPIGAKKKNKKRIKNFSDFNKK